MSSRLVTISRPNDEEIRIPANGFSLAGTVSKPANATGKLPAVILVGGSGPTDRDELVFGIPILGQIADALADAGFIVLRYDKRGVGQSGGRTEVGARSSTLPTTRAAVKVLSDRKDVDRKRIAVVGHSEGGWIALMAAKDKRVAAVGLVATAGVTGRELNLYQVTHGLERSTRSDAERQATIDLQKKIQQAVVTGLAGNDQRAGAQSGVRSTRRSSRASSRSIRRSSSKDVRQPILIVQGELDTQVPPANAEKLETLAKARKKRNAGEGGEDSGRQPSAGAREHRRSRRVRTLTDQHVSPAVTTELIGWLRQTLVQR